MTDDMKRCVEALRFKEDFECIECPIPAGNCEENCLLDVAADLIESLSTELEHVKREKDAAVKDIEELRMKYFRGTCHYCKHHGKEYISNDCMDCHGSNWQWRGVKEET